jgi:hypothetical protein
MTNKDKFLKDGVDIEELDKALVDYLCNEEKLSASFKYISVLF